MASITASTYLDTAGGTRTAGEAWTMTEGAILTVRTDTRWYSGAPASMTGSLGAITCTAGGFEIDATKVRWLAYESGSGNAPAIGTSITQGGVTGILLGVWYDLASAPIAVGSGIPPTGYLKFLEVTGGTFSAGALAGISASASRPDIVGWIEVVRRISTAMTVPRLGYYKTRGAWFELGTTSGSPNQVIQTPTNGGGANTHVPAVQIETAPGSGVYEWYPAVFSTWFLAANIATDERGKYVQSIGSGQIRIGYDGTANTGYTPVAGCKIRMPNIIGHQCSSGTDETNNDPNSTIANRPSFTTSASGDIDIQNMSDDWYHLFASPYRVRVVDSCTFDIHSSTGESSATYIDNYCNGIYTGASIALTLTTNTLGGTIKNSKFIRGTAASNGHVVAIATSAEYTIQNCWSATIAYARNTGARTWSLNQSFNISIEDCRGFNGDFRIDTCFDITIKNHDHNDRLFGNTNSTSGIFGIIIAASSDNIMIDGFTCGMLNTIANLNPYSAIFYTQNSSNITIRKAGTQAAPIQITATTNAPQYIYQDAGVCANVKVKRLYFQNTRTNAYITVNTSKNITLESVHGTTGAASTNAVNALIKGIRSASSTTTGVASVYGSHFFDMFNSDTAGRIWFAFNEPSAATLPYFTTTFGSGAGFNASGQAAMKNLGDQIIAEMSYFAIGHTSFQNAAPSLTGTNTGNFTYEYDINTGTGFSGTYKTLSGANLSGETIDPAIGFKLRLRITTATANATNALTYITLLTNTTLSAQTNNLYPLNTVAATYELTGLASGTEVVLFNGSHTELSRGIVATNRFTYNYTWNEEIGNITGCYALIWKGDKIPYIISGITLGSSNQSIPVTQNNDLVYSEPLVAKTTFNTGSKLQIMNAGVTSVSIQELYSDWKYWLRQGSNAQYDFAYSATGGNTISGSTSIPFYLFQINGWKIRPDEANHTLEVIEGIIVATGDPFVNTVGTYTVRINYQQPVQAITVNTAGGDTKEDIYSYFTNSGRQDTFKADVSGLAEKTDLADLADKDDVSDIRKDIGDTQGIVLSI